MAEKSKTIWLILNSKGQRQRHKDGKLSPAFEYSTQAQKYIDSYFGGSPYLRVVWRKNSSRGKQK